jgi:hypothetical protein
MVFITLGRTVISNWAKHQVGERQLGHVSLEPLKIGQILSTAFRSVTSMAVTLESVITIGRTGNSQTGNVTNYATFVKGTVCGTHPVNLLAFPLDEGKGPYESISPGKSRVSRHYPKLCEKYSEKSNQILHQS